MAEYVLVSLEAFDWWARSRGFTRVDHGEVCYERVDSEHPGIVYRVYSSIPVTGDAGRGRGEDAIRVVALARSPIPGLGLEAPIDKTARVYRVTSVKGVFQRLLQRLRVVSDAARARVGRTCPRCSGPAYTDSGRCFFRTCRE